MTRVGVTGHQKLGRSGDWDWVSKSVDFQLYQLEKPLLCLTSLAVGADQLVAQLIIAQGGALYAVLPFRDIERTLSPNNLPKFLSLVKQSQVEVLSSPPGDDEEAFLAAGKRVVDLCEVLFAIWDGKPARGKGGSGDVVSYARQVKRKTIHFNPETQTVLVLQ